MSRAVQPEIQLSASDRKLLRLMSELLLDQLSHEAKSSNISISDVPLSDGEARELLGLLETFVDSRQFIEAGSFVESLTHQDSFHGSSREIYFSMRKRRGRTRVASSYHWAEFEMRLGIHSAWHPQAAANIMTTQKFLDLEQKLLVSAGVHPRVVGVVIRLIARLVPKENINGRTLPPIRRSDIKTGILAPFAALRLGGQVRSGEIPSSKIAAAITLVADISVLFTTRDWSVAGTLSTIAGASAASVL